MIPFTIFKYLGLSAYLTHAMMCTLFPFEADFLLFRDLFHRYYYYWTLWAIEPCSLCLFIFTRLRLLLWCFRNICERICHVFNHYWVHLCGYLSFINGLYTWFDFTIQETFVTQPLKWSRLSLMHTIAGVTHSHYERGLDTHKRAL